MGNERLPWLLSLPLMAAGCLAAHATAYGIAEPVGEEAEHGYLGPAPLLLAIAIAVGVVAALRAAFSGRVQGGGPVHVFALLPPLAFVVQEHLERMASDGAAVLETGAEPTFLLGLALQLPFALCALVVARCLRRAADSFAELRRARTLRLRPSPMLRPRFVLDAPPVPALASAHAGRAPPVAV